MTDQKKQLFLDTLTMPELTGKKETSLALLSRYYLEMDKARGYMYDLCHYDDTSEHERKMRDVAKDLASMVLKL